MLNGDGIEWWLTTLIGCSCFHIEQAMEQIFQIAGNSPLESELCEIWTCWHWAKLHPYTCKKNSLNLFQNSLNMCLIYWMITGTSGWLHMFTVMVASSLPFWIRNLSDLCAFDMVYQWKLYDTLLHLPVPYH